MRRPSELSRIPSWAMASPTDRLVVEVVCDEGEVSRSRLAELTRIPKSTLTQHVGVLLRRGVLVEVPRPTSGRRGRPGTNLFLNPRLALSEGRDSSKGVVLAVLLRHGSHFAGGPVDCGLLAPDGRLLALRQSPAGPDPIASAAVAAKALLSDRTGGALDVRAAVLAVPFPLALEADHRAVSEHARIVPAFSQVLGCAPHHRLAEALGVPVLLGNDADLGAVAEATWGWGRRVEDLLYVKCLTGIGVGVIQRHRLMTAGDITTGELEHMPVEDGSACSCGGAGCRGGRDSRNGALELANRLRPLGASSNTLAELQSAAGRRDPGTLDALRRFGEDIGQGLAATQVLWSPPVVVLEAGLGPAHAALAHGVEGGMNRWGLALRSAPARITQSLVGMHAELRGACAALGVTHATPAR
jgi:predicted NBD/HSP70 family sugar kinase/DNA-binding transcriptional ArsR family regulator